MKHTQHLLFGLVDGLEKIALDEDGGSDTMAPPSTKTMGEEKESKLKRKKRKQEDEMKGKQTKETEVEDDEEQGDDD